MTKKDGKKGVAIVTGGTRGIGLEITKALCADGYDVAAVYRGNEDAAKVCEKETGAKAFRADVSNFDDCEKLVASVTKDMGDIDVLVNNAGITRDGTLHKMSLEQWRQVMSANLDSCFNMSRVVIEGMRDRSYGRIVNISSINGQKGQFGQTNYAAAKAGMIGFTKSLALETAAKGITVNAICPGYIATDMTESMREDVLKCIIGNIPVGRMGEADEIAAVVSFLVSDKAGFITGSTITANGGQYMV